MAQQKVIIIGATSGMGRELACIYAAMGCMVAVTGRRAHLLDEIKQAFPQNILTAAFDVTGSSNRQQVDRLIQALGGLDLLIYNSGFGDPTGHLDWSAESTTIQTNVAGFAEIVCHAYLYFFHKGGGQIAITSSVASLRGNRWAPAYSASKAFMSRYAEGLNFKARKEGKDIVVTDLRPGFVDTKPAKGPRRFWVASAQKAAGQMVNAIQKRRRVAYITRRWWLVAQIMKVVPFPIFAKLG